MLLGTAKHTKQGVLFWTADYAWFSCLLTTHTANGLLNAVFPALLHGLADRTRCVAHTPAEQSVRAHSHFPDNWLASCEPFYLDGANLIRRLGSALCFAWLAYCKKTVGDLK